MLERGIQWARDRARAARARNDAPAAARPLTQASVTSYFQPGRGDDDDRQQQTQTAAAAASSRPASSAAAAQSASLSLPRASYDQQQQWAAPQTRPSQPQQGAGRGAAASSSSSGRQAQASAAAAPWPAQAQRAAQPSPASSRLLVVNDLLECLRRPPLVFPTGSVAAGEFEPLRLISQRLRRRRHRGRVGVSGVHAGLAE